MSDTTDFKKIYNMAIMNCALTLARSNQARKSLMSLSPRATKRRKELEAIVSNLDAFDLSAALAVAFAKRKEDVVIDIVKASVEADEIIEKENWV